MQFPWEKSKQDAQTRQDRVPDLGVSLDYGDHWGIYQWTGSHRGVDPTRLLLYPYLLKTCCGDKSSAYECLSEQLRRAGQYDTESMLQSMRTHLDQGSDAYVLTSPEPGREWGLALLSSPLCLSPLRCRRSTPAAA